MAAKKAKGTAAKRKATPKASSTRKSSRRLAPHKVKHPVK